MRPVAISIVTVLLCVNTLITYITVASKTFRPTYSCMPTEDTHLYCSCIYAPLANLIVYTYRGYTLI